jgi:hypothetical protein
MGVLVLADAQKSIRGKKLLFKKPGRVTTEDIFRHKVEILLAVFRRIVPVKELHAIVSLRKAGIL